MLGATGSIGSSTLDVVARHPDRFKVHAVSGHHRIDELAGICQRFEPRLVAVPDDAAAQRLIQQGVGSRTEILVGRPGLVQIATSPDADTVMAAIVGAAGLAPTLAAARAGKRILLANKEALVMAGAVFVDAASSAGAEVLPIDSEHNAVFQCLPLGRVRAGVRRIVLTASGGPFRQMSLEAMAAVTPEQACRHPNWSMGRKISVDSATMMNKGLELIEAHYLFRTPDHALDVVVHPQSIVHSMVEYDDGSVLAQLGNPDMRTPIAHAMGYPERIDSGVESLSLIDVARLDFEAPDYDRFRCLRLARAALSAEGSAPCVLNAANEVAVDAFLDRRIRFVDIADVCESTLEALGDGPAGECLDSVMAIDAEARGAATHRIAELDR
ncbi:MAG: 1-deoxy-D-xylulose-5-phosphate reductoisomerase [Burkholderiaceae bacterium]|nr:1-deoxy-D-xylulose-5-phosphate reductoisomerase [Burkholderiaceae bacterium]